MTVRAITPLFLLFLLSTFAFAQTQITTGVIQGTVTDPSGAVLPGADVSIVNLDTNLTKTLTSDSDGRFTAPLLPPGRYKITIKKTGFAQLQYQSVDLTVGQALTLAPKLGVAGASEIVTVTDTPTVDTTKTESSSTINQRTVANIPILGRKFEDFLTLTPGVSVVQGPDGDEITFNGQRGIFNNISLDGGDYNNGFFGEQNGGQRAAVDITLEAVQEFQVIASASNAEFGRTAGGIVNVISKSGTNELHGSIFHYQRLEALSSNTSDGKPLKDFHREQFGATVGGPFRRDKAFGFLAIEQITANLQRANLSEPVGTCSTQTPTIAANQAEIASSAECQRRALLNFYRAAPFNQDEGLPVRRPVHNTAVLAKFDFNLNNNNQLSASYNFDASRKVNETFDVPTYGTSANGIEGTSYINVANVNLNSSLRANLLNEAHFMYSREVRPREASPSSVKPDTAIGGALPTPFRFGNPFFLGPNIDETFWRMQVKDNVSWIKGSHNVKFGGDWLHSRNSQVFRGFFEGRYIFSDVVGFLRYAAPAAANGFGPSVQRCSNGTYITPAAPFNQACPGGTTNQGTPLLLYLQGANGNLSPATDAAGASDIANEDFALFIQDKWQALPNLTISYGIRWEAQIFPDPTTPPAQTIYGQFLSNPLFPSDGTLPNQLNQWQPRLGIAWDIGGNQKSVFRASAGIYNARQNMLTQVGSITTNGVQQATVALGPFVPSTILPAYPNLAPAPPPPAPGTFPLFSGIRVFDRHYKNPRIYTANFAFEQDLSHDFTGYVDFTWSKGVYLTNFLNYLRSDRAAAFAFMQPQLGEAFVTSSRANSLYRGVVFGLRKRFSHSYQLDTNYTFSTDYDNDSNERDPFTDRSGPATPANPFPLRNDYTYSNRDIRHKFNFILSGDMPWGLQGNLRIQARSAQPLTVGGIRNSGRADNVYSSVDWRLARPFRFGDRFALTPSIDMFNTFNSENNVIPEPSDPLFNFQGYIRQGVGDPRQVQFAVKFTF